MADHRLKAEAGFLGSSVGEAQQKPAPAPQKVFDWEVHFRTGQLVPIAGWWFKIMGIVREQEPLGALVLEPTGERTGGGERRG